MEAERAEQILAEVAEIVAGQLMETADDLETPACSPSVAARYLREYAEELRNACRTAKEAGLDSPETQ